MDLLKLWLLATAAIVIGFLVWGFVPILVPVGLVFAGLVVPVVIAVKGARWLERRRGPRLSGE